jgi:hypothetical protein
MSTADLEQEISGIDAEIAELQASLCELTGIECGITRPGSQQKTWGIQTTMNIKHAHQMRCHRKYTDRQYVAKHFC